ncbi:transmembrane protein 144-like [Halichondria panicea]|uniref:transmembrane protein 144-like n=1 Tax=Halichondria panicea TaxID=6063 RepID=UPI00312B5986
MKHVPKILLLLAVSCSLAIGQDNYTCDVDFKTWNKTSFPPVCTADEWICFTTSGGMNQTGGSIDKTRCGDACNSKDGSQMWIGFLGAAIAIVFFGSNFIPVKKFETGDGMFFQWVLCVGIWLVGLVVNMIQNQPPIFLPALVGGISWTTGNLLVVPIIKLIGLTMGLTVWGVTNMLAGWFTGVVILDQEVSCPGLNYGGVAVVVVSVIVLAFVKSEGKKTSSTSATSDPPINETTRLLSSRTSSLEGSLRARVLQQNEKKGSIQRDVEKVVFNSGATSSNPAPQDVDLIKPEDADASWVDRFAERPIISKVLAFSLCVVAGLLFGFQFLPIQFLKYCDDGAHSCQDLDYVFSDYCGILFTSTFYFIIYCAVSKNKPKVYPRLILPGLISGIMWGIAMTAWFLANQHLSLAVSFPIVTAGPGFVSSAWGILVYREIKGWRNIILFFVAFIISACGLIMDSLSKCTVSC